MSKGMESLNKEQKMKKTDQIKIWKRAKQNI